MLGFTKFKINRLVNRRELYSNFSYNKWNQLDTGSKWKCLQQLENHFAAEQGRPAVKVLPISSKEVRGDYGGYDPDKNVIYINRDLVEYGTLVGPVDINHPTQLDANMQLFDTIAHEGYHAYQGYAIKHPGFHKDMKQVKEWAINDRNVKYFRRGDEYLVQPRERDAWKYGSEKTREAFDEMKDVFYSIAQKDGCMYTGKAGSGHFMKMVHNGIEYGMMQAIAEGFHVLEKSEFDYDLAQVADNWNHGSVIRGWLMELAKMQFSKHPGLKDIKGVVAASGEAKWTVETALEMEVPVPVIALSLMIRNASLEDDSFSCKVVSALRNGFGGHAYVEAGKEEQR